MPQRAQIPFEGVLNCWNDEHDLPDLLLFIGRSAKTGILQFSNPESDKTVHFKNGKIVFAESSSQDDGLGQFLLRTGKISLMDYARVAKKIRPGKRFGKILVEEKILASQELVPAVVGQVRGILLGLFRRTETWYSFKEMDLPPTQSVTLDLPVARIILEGVRYVESWRRISKGVGNLDSVYRRSDTKAVEWSRMKLDARVRELLDMMEQPMSLEDICTRATLPDFEACRYLWAFRSLEWIENANANANVDVTEQAAAKSATPAAPMAPPPEAVITKIAVTPPPASVPVEADGSLPERLVETQMSLKREAEAAVRATEAAKIEIEQDSPAPPPANELVQTQLANEPGPSTPRPEQTQLVVEPPQAPAQLNQTQLAVEPPAPPRPDLSKLVVKPPPAAPQRDQTQLAVEPPASAPLDQTQLAVEPPAPPRPDQTQLVVEPPASTPPANQTQLIVEPPAPPPSTGELMETILEGGTPGPVAPQASDDENDTQFFQMPSSPASSAPTGPPSGFEALATDPVPTEAPMRAEVVTNPSVRAPIVELGETSEPLSGIEATPLEAGFMESFAAEPPLETAKVPKAPHVNELELELDPEGIEKALGDD